MFHHYVDNPLKCGNILFWSSPISLGFFLPRLRGWQTSCKSAESFFLTYILGPFFLVDTRGTFTVFPYTSWTTEVLGLSVGTCCTIPPLQHSLFHCSPVVMVCDPQQAYQSPREKASFTESKPIRGRGEEEFNTILSSPYTCSRIHSKGIYFIYTEKDKALFLAFISIAILNLHIYNSCLKSLHLLIPSSLSFLGLFILMDFSLGYGSHFHASSCLVIFDECWIW